MARRGRNEGSIYKRKNGTWRGQVSVDGNRLSYTADSRLEVHEWLRSTLDKIDRGLILRAYNLTIEEYMTDWFNAKKTTLRPKTAYDYERIISKYLLPELGKVKLKDLTTYRVTKFYTHLTETGKGARTVRLIHGLLHSVLQYALQSGFINRNPTFGAILPRQSQREMKVLNESQIADFLIAAQDSRYKALYQLAITTGMRFSELIGLKWGDIDWTKGILKVQRQLQFLPHGGFKFMEPKTKSGFRSIMLGNTTLRMLADHRRESQGKDLTGEDLIFVNGIGTEIYFKRFNKDFKRVLGKARLPQIRFHDLRHTAATLMVANGIPAIIVARILGHSKPSVTLNVYSHTSVEMQSEAAALMENLVTPIPIKFIGEKNPGQADKSALELHPIAPDFQDPKS